MHHIRYSGSITAIIIIVIKSIVSIVIVIYFLEIVKAINIQRPSLRIFWECQNSHYSFDILAVFRNIRQLTFR